MYEIAMDIEARAGWGEVCITVEENHSSNGYLCEQMSTSKETRRKTNEMQRFATLVSVVGGSVQPH
jgi:hypothetical protein